MFNRILNLPSLLEDGSHFLFGARGTGKSFLVRHELENSAFVINLLRSDIFTRLAENPSYLESMILDSNAKTVVIDEVQKLPALLDEVHRLIEEQHIVFLLTGSSARKLKREHANLLAGRARLAYLHPLTFPEIPQFNLNQYLLWGGLPRTLLSKNKSSFLESYVTTYLKEEVLAEQAARSLPHFSRFLKTAALCSGQLINFTGIARDAQLPPSTVRNYFEILNDTLVGHILEPFIETKKRKAIETAKFYLFDLGVRNHILNIRDTPERSDVFGQAFEHFIMMELKAYESYRLGRSSLHFWRSLNGQEVDFVLEGHVGIEVKASRKTTDRDARHLRALDEEVDLSHMIVVSLDPLSRQSKDGVSFLPYDAFLKRLWRGDYIRSNTNAD